MSSPYVRTKIMDKITAQYPAIDVINATNKLIDRGVDINLFIAVEFKMADEDLMTIGAEGNNTYREAGVFTVNAVVETGIGSDAVLAQIELIRNLFRGKQADGIDYFTASPANESSMTIKDGEWFSMSTLIEYSYDYQA